MRHAVPLALLALLALLAAPALAAVGVGDMAPDFTLKDQDGKDVKLSDFRGKKNVLLAFYPKDFTSGCTLEMKTLVADERKITSRDTVIVEVSGGTCESHASFARTNGATFRVLADTDLAVAKAYDVYTPASGGFAMRSAFLVDKDGKIRWLDRDLRPPQGTLDGTELLAQVVKLAGLVDPVAQLAELPSPEREGKTTFVHFAQALLGEDLNALTALVHPEACGRPGETPAMQRDRRKAMLERWRGFFDRQDLRSLRFDDTIDVRGTRVFAKEAATTAALTSFGPDARDVAGRLGDGELLVVGRTSAPKAADGTTLLAREVVLRLRKDGDAWKVVEVAPLP